MGVDADPNGDGTVQETVVDILVQNCPDWHTEDATSFCRGSAPLTLQFSTISSQPIDSFLWQFESGAAEQEGSLVSHTFHTPGTYDATLLVSGAFGILEVVQPALIEVEAAVLGDYCEQDANCATVHCHCPPDHNETNEDCPPTLSGMCAQACTDQACNDGICADLRKASEPNPPNPNTWRQPLCLPSCETDDNCSRSGFECVEVLRYEPLSMLQEWVSVCVPPLLAEIGQPCADTGGEPDADRCWSGQCADLGAGGLCAFDCEEQPCPSFAACAEFSGPGAFLCLSACEADHPCDDDPLLGCETADASGQYGFVPTEQPTDPNQTYCAPRRCTESDDCGLLGRCDTDLGGFCQPIER
jgi:PKD repeat protein